MTRGLGVLLCVGGFACASDDFDLPPLVDEVPVLQVVLGEFDGSEFHFRTLQPGETLNTALEPVDAEVGAAQHYLVDLASYGCTGAACTGDDYVAFSNVAGSRRAIANGAAQGTDALWTTSDTSDCGAPPTTGVCQEIRMRNLYASQLERVYVGLTTLTPTGSTTSVVAPTTQPFAATEDFGAASPTAGNAFWRAGTIGRLSPETGGVTQHWAFTGATPEGSNFTFRFLIEVRGQIAMPTRRATVVGIDNPSPNYAELPSGNAVNGNIDMTPDGRFVVFASTSSVLTGQGSGSYIVRHDMTTGENLVVTMTNGTTTVPSGCTAAQPSISADGNRIAFQSGNCPLASVSGRVRPTAQIYVRDVAAQTTTLVSINTSGSYGNLTSLSPRISADGSAVVFRSGATNLIAGYPGVTASRPTSCMEVYRRDLALASTTHVSAIAGSVPNATTGYTSNCTSTAPAGTDPDIDATGGTIVFRGAQPLVADDTNGDFDVYVYVHGAGPVDLYRVSLSSAGAQIAAPTGFANPSISPDGSTIALSSTASGLTGSSNGSRHVYVRSSAAGANGTLERVTETATGAIGSGGSGGTPFPVLSNSGRFVGFISNLSNLASPYIATTQNFYVCDTGAPSPVLDRCFLANTIQLTPSNDFARIGGGGTGNAGRPAIACADEDESCYVAYLMDGSSTGLGSGGLQVWVSPIGDPRYQMSSPSP
jgi:Tol biopolymer transport system component